MTKKLLITGSNKGIGLELAKQFKSAGYEIYSLLRTTNSEIQQLSTQLIDGIDFNDPTTLQNSIERFNVTHFDCCVFNAGIFHNETLDVIDSNAVNQIIDQFKVNSLAPVILASQSVKFMSSNSKLVVITSRMGSIDDNQSGSFYGYRMSKAALNSAAKSLSVDLKARGISVGIFHPGYVKTEMTNYTGNSTPKDVAKQLFEQISKLNIINSGQFKHANGDVLPW